jgi:hypothetical protein
MTTRENKHEMIKRIPFRDLEKTFQHAITICFRLGISYLWIDALCILQGDTGDWEHEAMHMGSIYSSCVLNIVAADSPDG